MYDGEGFPRRWKHQRPELSEANGREFDAKKRQAVADIRTEKVTLTKAIDELDELLRNLLCWQRDEYIRSQVPSEFLRPLDREEMLNPFATDQVMAWWEPEYDADGEPLDRYVNNLRRGIVAFGKTGTGKTRAILSRLCQVYAEDGSDQRFEFVRIVDFAAKVRLLAPRRGDELEDYIVRLSDAPILFLDDLHQAKLTPRYAEELFRVVDTRSSDELPLFVTCQMAGPALVEKLTSDNSELRPTAEAIVRRLRDHCHPIDFDYYPKLPN